MEENKNMNDLKKKYADEFRATNEMREVEDLSSMGWTDWLQFFHNDEFEQIA